MAQFMYMAQILPVFASAVAHLKIQEQFMLIKKGGPVNPTASMSPAAQRKTAALFWRLTAQLTIFRILLKMKKILQANRL